MAAACCVGTGNSVSAEPFRHCADEDAGSSSDRVPSLRTFPGTTHHIKVCVNRILFYYFVFVYNNFTISPHRASTVG